jgi:hypothetical protein
MSDKYNPPNAPDLKETFNNAAKPPKKARPSEKGIATKAELNERTKEQKELAQKLHRLEFPPLDPPGVAEMNKAIRRKNINKIQNELQENQSVKAEIKRRLDARKKKNLTQEFNKSVDPTLVD